MSLPDAEIGAERLTEAGSPSPAIRWSPTCHCARGCTFEIADDDRALYHAAAAVAANHLVASGMPNVSGRRGCRPTPYGARPWECGERRGPRPVAARTDPLPTRRHWSPTGTHRPSRTASWRRTKQCLPRHAGWQRWKATCTEPMGTDAEVRRLLDALRQAGRSASCRRWAISTPAISP